MKYFWLNLTTTSTSASDTGKISRAIRVMRGLMESIDHQHTDHRMVTLVISWVMLWFRLWPVCPHRLVMAGVAPTPTVRFSKYASGRRLIFSLIWRRKS